MHDIVLQAFLLLSQLHIEDGKVLAREEQTFFTTSPGLQQFQVHFETDELLVTEKLKSVLHR